MSLALLALTAPLLTLERATYVFIARRPQAFLRLCRHPAVGRLGPPYAVVRTLLYVFKALQYTLFAAWCLVHAGGRVLPAAPGVFALALGGAAIVVGQILNWSVFYRLGTIGVFYGDRFGYRVPWCHGFPFSLFPHPQYTGSVLTIWGFFLAMRFPNDDWYVLPALETFYYAMGAHLEERPLEAAETVAPLAGEQARLGGPNP